MSPVSTSLTTNNCYLYFSDGDSYSIRTPSVNNQGYLIQESRTQKTKPIEKNCETGWIPFGNRCVMKYEARAKSDADGTIDVDGLSVVLTSNSPTSTGEKLPWTTITQIDAKKECESIGAHLITNAEWMAIARDVEQVDSNWTGGAVGSGVLKRGNVGDAAEGNYNGGDPETGILNDLAKLKLSNGQEIYHLSGNVYEWVDETITEGEQYINFNSKEAGWYEYNAAGLFDVANKLPYSEAGPKGTYTTPSASGMGRIYIKTSSGSSINRAFLRSLCWNNTSGAGVFALNLEAPSSYSYSNIGFRCAR